MSTPIEALLRPPVEYYSVVCYSSLSLISMGAPEVFLLPGGVGYALGAAMALRAASQARYGTRLVKYQRGLRFLPGYKIHPKELPKSRVTLVLGRGFEWGTKHTQRLADVKRTENESLFIDSLSYRVARKVIDGVGSQCKWLMAPFNSQSVLNPFPPRPYVEGSSEIHGVGMFEKEIVVGLRQAERVAHTFVVGTTRVGKTRLLEVMATQDIHNGDVVIVFDPKGDGDLLSRLYTEAQRAGREHDFKILHLGFPEHSMAYNPIGSYSRITEVANRIAGQLSSEGGSAAFKDFAWLYVNTIAQAIEALNQTISFRSLRDAARDFDGLIVEYFEAYFRRLGGSEWEDSFANKVASEDKQQGQLKERSRESWAMVELYKLTNRDDDIGNGLIKTFENDKNHHEKLVNSLYPLLEKLTTGAVANLLSPVSEDRTPVFTWSSIIKNGGIVYVGLDALTDAEVAGVVGNAMFADLTSEAGDIYKREANPRKICLHADEFNELVGKEFVPLANKAGGAGFQLTVYTQTLSDIIARFDSTARAGQVIGNLGTLIMLRVKEKATAELLTSRLKEVEINQLMVESGTTDSSNPETDIHFVSNTRQRITSQRVTLLDPGDLDALPKGHAFALMAGRLYKLRLPLFSDDDELPAGIATMVSAMKRGYSAANQEDWSQASPFNEGGMARESATA